MTNCNVTIEIRNYEPKNLPNIQFSDFICLFKLDNFEGTINLGENSIQKINHMIKNIKKDIKYNIRLMNIKLNSLIGISDFIIPFQQIKKSNINSTFEVKKLSSLTMIESTKRLLFNSLSKDRNFLIEISSNVEILSKSKTKSFIVRNNPSFPTMPSSIQSKKSFFKNNIYLSSKIPFNTQGKNTIENDLRKNFNLISTPPNKNLKKNSEQSESKNLSMMNNSNRTVGNQTKRITSDSLRREFFGLKTNNNKKNKSRQNELDKQNKSKSITYEISKEYHSHIPSNNVGDENNSTELLEKKFNMEYNFYDNYFSDLLTFNDESGKKEKIDNAIYSAFNTFKSNYFVFEKNNSEGNLNAISQKNIKANIETLLKYYFLIMEKFSFLNQKKRQLSLLLLSNIEKINYLKKQLNTLSNKKLNLSINKIKINLNKNLKNKVIKNKITIKKNEYEIYKNLFNIINEEYTINKFKEEEIEKEEEKKNLLLSSAVAAINLYGNISQIYGDDEDSKIRLKALLFRFNIKEKEENYNSFQLNENVIEMGNNISGKLNIDKIKAIKEVDEEKEEDSEEDNGMSKEEKIDNFIQEFQNKKNRKIKFEKIAPFKYKFGTQNIILKIDDDNQTFVQFGNGYITLEKFVEKNEKIEEGKLKNKSSRMYKSYNKSFDFKKAKK